jgi:membrane protein implicated in regulation of membrane protease activity
MQTKAKLALLELIGGFFGWLWIGASLFALYALAMAVFSTHPWSQFLWAVGVSVLAKWLARGFRDNQQRVAFVAQLISQGHTPEQASKEWLSRYMGSKQQ